MKIDIKFENIDEELLFKRFKLKVTGTEIITPTKVSHRTNPVSPINEIYKSFTADKLDKGIRDEGFERQINADIKRESITSKVNICLVDYSDIQMPNDKQIEVLSDLQYEHSAIVITPILSIITRKLTEEKLVDTFIDITNRYLDVVETLNNKSIVGVIPSRMPRRSLEQIINNFLKRDVRSFIIDFDGRSIDINLSWIRNLMRTLKEKGLFEESFLYSVNANEGKFMKNANEILAKDFISTGFGIDVLGLNHVPPRMDSEAWTKIKGQRRENTFRLFNSKTYGYLRKTESELKEMNITKREELKNFNITEQYKESQILQQKLKEENSIEPYIKTKSQVTKEMIKKIKKLRNNIFHNEINTKLDVF